MLQTNTAILIFSRTASAEAPHRNWAGKHTMVNTQIANTLLRHTIQEAKKTTIPHFWINETEQQGNNFAEKLYNATQVVLQKGFSNIIIIGGDVANITATHFLKASAQLQHSSMVAGPDKRGGVYLLALQQKHCTQAFFTGLSWQTNVLFTQIIGLAISSYTPHSILPTLADSHQFLLHQNWKQIQAIFGKSVGQLIQNLIAFTNHFYYCICNKTSRQLAINLPLRAPPVR